MKTIKKTIIFNTSPHKVYDILMSSKKHIQFTGSKAVISNKVGGKFSAYDGSLHGTNLELKPDHKIVQALRYEMDNWPQDHFSKATFEFKTAGNKTKLIFTQTGVPNKCVKSITQGWNGHYWIPIKEKLGN